MPYKNSFSLFDEDVSLLQLLQSDMSNEAIVNPGHESVSANAAFNVESGEEYGITSSHRFITNEASKYSAYLSKNFNILSHLQNNIIQSNFGDINDSISPRAEISLDSSDCLSSMLPEEASTEDAGLLARTKLENNFFKKQKDARAKEIEEYIFKINQNPNFIGEEYIPIRDYFAQRDALLKQYANDNEHQDREQLIKAQESINKTRNQLHYGRGNVIPDIEATHFLTAAKTFTGSQLMGILTESNLHKYHKPLARCLSSADVILRENSENEVDFERKKRELILPAAIALCLESSNCNGYAALSMLYYTSQLDKQQITNSMVGAAGPLGEEAFDHIWTEHGNLSIDAWAEKSAIFTEDINPLHTNKEKFFSLTPDSANLYLVTIEKIVKNIKADKNLMEFINNNVIMMKNKFIESYEAGEFDYKNNKFSYDPVSITSDEFTKKSKADPITRRKNFLQEKSGEYLERLNLSKNIDNLETAKEIIAYQMNLSAALFQDILKIGVNQKDFRLMGVQSSVASINPTKSKDTKDQLSPPPSKRIKLSRS